MVSNKFLKLKPEENETISDWNKEQINFKMKQSLKWISIFPGKFYSNCFLTQTHRIEYIWMTIWNNQQQQQQQ